MLKRVLTGVALATGAALMLQVPATTQRGGEAPNGSNPLLYGRDRASRYWAMMADCARARVAALEQARGRS